MTLPVLLITARDSVPVFVISPAKLVNHLPGWSVSSNAAKFLYGEAPASLGIFTVGSPDTTLNAPIIPASICANTWQWYCQCPGPTPSPTSIIKECVLPGIICFTSIMLLVPGSTHLWAWRWNVCWWSVGLPAWPTPKIWKRIFWSTTPVRVGFVHNGLCL